MEEDLERRLTKIEYKLDKLNDELLKSNAAVFSSMETQKTYVKRVALLFVDYLRNRLKKDLLSQYKSLLLGVMAIYVALFLGGMSMILTSGVEFDWLTSYSTFANGVILIVLSFSLYFFVCRPIEKRMRAIEEEKEEEMEGV